MTNVMWASSGFKGEGFSEKCPAEKGKGAPWGRVFVGQRGEGNMVVDFCVGPHVQDNKMNSPENYISQSYMDWI